MPKLGRYVGIKKQKKQKRIIIKQGQFFFTAVFKLPADPDIQKNNGQVGT